MNRIVEGLIAWIAAHWQGTALGLLCCGLLLCALASFELLPNREIGLYCGLFLAVYAALVAISRLPATVLGPSIDRRLEAWVASSGAGFYGLLASVRLLQLEFETLLDEGVLAFSSERSWSRTLAQSLWGFSADSVTNLVQSVVWPIQLFGKLGLFNAVLVIGPLWLVYALGARAFPELHERMKGGKVATPEPPSTT